MCKMAVIGIGAVGQAVSSRLAQSGLCSHLVLVNRTHAKAVGYALDLDHCSALWQRPTRVYAGTLADCVDAQVVLLCLSGGINSFQRTTLLDSAVKAVRPIVQELRSKGFSGHYIVLSNPVDILCRYVYQWSGLPSSHIMGTGTYVDTLRLRYYLAEALHCSPSLVTAWVLGEHGETQVIPWSQVRVDGLLLEEYGRLHGVNITPLWRQEVAEKERMAALGIYTAVGATSCGVATVAVDMCQAIALDEHRVFSASVCAKGVYDVMDDVYAGLLCRVGRSGVEHIEPLPIFSEEAQQFRNSCDSLRQMSEMFTEKI